MKYIIVVNFNSNENFFVRVKDDVYEEILDPRFATTFPSKSSAIQWAKDNSTMDKYMKAQRPEPHIKKFEESLANGLVRRSFPLLSQSVMNVPYNSTKHDWSDIVRWHYNYTRGSENSVAQSVFKGWYDAMFRVPKFVNDVVSYYGDEDDSRYTTFQFWFRRRYSYADFTAELNFILSNLDVTLVDSDGNRVFKVFDKFLSENGNSVDLVLLPNGNWNIVQGTDAIRANLSTKEMFDWMMLHRDYSYGGLSEDEY